MKMSRLFGTTLREAPATAEAPGYQLLLRGAFIRQLGQGIFSYLPLGWRVMRNIEQILHQEMDAAGGIEMSMPVVHRVSCGSAAAASTRSARRWRASPTGGTEAWCWP